MPFVPTGFPALDSMIAGNGACRGFPRGSMSLLVGAPGSGKTTILKKVCERAHAKGLRVVWVEPGGSNSAVYRSVDGIYSIDDLAHLMAKLLHPNNQKCRADLIVVDDVSSFTVEPTGPIANMARSISTMFHGDLGSTAVVLSVQSRKSSSSTVREYNPPVSLEHRSCLTIGVLKNGECYDLKLVKSVVSLAGVSCTVNPGDLMDRSKIPTRYERILRGRD